MPRLNAMAPQGTPTPTSHLPEDVRTDFTRRLMVGMVLTGGIFVLYAILYATVWRDAATPRRRGGAGLDMA